MFSFIILCLPISLSTVLKEKTWLRIFLHFNESFIVIGLFLNSALFLFFMTLLILESIFFYSFGSRMRGGKKEAQLIVSLFDLNHKPLLKLEFGVNICCPFY